MKNQINVITFHQYECAAVADASIVFFYFTLSLSLSICQTARIFTRSWIDKLVSSSQRLNIFHDGIRSIASLIFIIVTAEINVRGSGRSGRHMNFRVWSLLQCQNMKMKKKTKTLNAFKRQMEIPSPKTIVYVLCVIAIHTEHRRR